MWQSVDSKLQSLLARYASVAANQPILFGILAALLLAGTLAVIVAVLRGRSRQAYWCGVAMVAANFVLSWGDDTYTHVFRIAAIADQLRAGAPSLMLLDPVDGNVLPVLVYYSLVPYLLPVLLDLAGLTAMVAYKAIGVLQFIVMALGVAALVDSTATTGSRDKPRGDYLAALLFVTATYVWSLWDTRASLAEFWVASLIPWVARWLIVPNGQRMLILLFSLQVATHPIVLLHGLVGELLVAYALARVSLLEMIRRTAGPLVLGLALGSPFWLPQFLWQDLILGPAGLPTRFVDTFLTWRELVDPRNMHSIGLSLPLGIAAVIVAARQRLSARFWWLAAATAATLAIETVYLRPLAVHIPMLAISLFIWRLLFPAAFLAFGTLLVGVREAPPMRPDPLPILAILSVTVMAWVMLSLSPNYLRKLSESIDDAQARRQHHDSRPVWGVREFLPNNTRPPRLCPPEAERQTATFADLRAGILGERPYLAVPQAPLGIVDYRAGDARLTAATCGDDLIVGPVPTGARVTVDESWLGGLLVIRLLALLAIVILPFAWPAAWLPAATSGRISQSRWRFRS